MSLVLPPVRIGSATWDWSKTYVFGVVNVTPDSFSDGGQYFSAEAAIAHGEALVAAGADALDIGGESTRPRSTPVDAAEELRRVLPVLEALAQRVSVPLSIDTYKASVAREAVAAGASIINDISGGALDPQIYSVAAQTGATLILGHLRGQPATMMQEVAFEDVVAEVLGELRQRLRLAVEAGVKADRLWIDPCLGFGKQAEHSLALVAASAALREQLGYPLLLGPSRKSFLGAVTGKPVGDRLLATAAACAYAIAGGTDALRLHDVAELRDAVLVADAIRRKKLPQEVRV